ncbi:MAG: tyrosine-type recombinase/integrase [Bacillota bacterium]
MLTGLRKSELASLTVARVDLEADVPYIVLNPEDEKNRQGADIPLRDDLAQDLRLWLADKLKAMQELSRRAGEPIPMKLPPNTPLFYVPTGLIRIFDRDLVAAGIAQLVKDPKTGKVRIVKQDDRGRTIDVHALRTTFGTHLSKGGVAPRTAQAAMRHSDIKLTMGVYTDPKLLDVRGALNVLPALPLDGSDPTTQSVTMTGTDSAPVQNATSPIALPIALPTGQSSTTEGKTGHQHATGADSDSPTETAVSATPVNKNGSESTVDPEPSSKRVMGLEPTTFTLAT